METIVVHPKNFEQSEVIKAFMKAQNIVFESQDSELPHHVIQSIERGLEQANQGKTISFNEFKSKHFKF